MNHADAVGQELNTASRAHPSGCMLSVELLVIQFIFSATRRPVDSDLKFKLI